MPVENSHTASISIDANVDFDGKIYIPGIFVGAEWNFPSLPEVGFNFDVGYNYVIDRNEIAAGGDLMSI